MQLLKRQFKEGLWRIGMLAVQNAALGHSAR
jgi:hypothetical protein